MRALFRVKKELHLFSHSSAPSTTRENTSHRAFPWREKKTKPLEGSCAFIGCCAPSGDQQDFSKGDIATVFLGLAYISLLYIVQYWSSASHR